MPLKTFDDLRRELGKHVAGDRIQMTVKRRVGPAATDFQELELEVTLGEDPN